MPLVYRLGLTSVSHAGSGDNFPETWGHGAPEKFHEPLATAVELRDGSIDRLVLWGRNGDGESIGTWESRDGGASWAAIKTLPRPKPQSNEVVFDGATWRTSDDGLLRAGTHRRVYVR